MKIAAVTASGYASERSEILAAGMDDYIRKPYRPAEVFECMARHLGVRLHASEGAARADGARIEELRAEQLSALPDELRNELRDALIMLNPARISTAIDRISQENRALGSILARYAAGYSYSTIFDAIMTEGEAKALPLSIPIEVRH